MRSDGPGIGGKGNASEVPLELPRLSSFLPIGEQSQAEARGRGRAILVEDGAFVEADQRLIALDIHASEEQPA